jgi:hypothetical protein
MSEPDIRLIEGEFQRVVVGAEDIIVVTVEEMLQVVVLMGGLKIGAMGPPQ